jgi:hypothetical protein
MAQLRACRTFVGKGEARQRDAGVFIEAQLETDFASH